MPAARAAALCTVDQLLDLAFFLSLLPLLAVLRLGGQAPIALPHPLLLLALMLSAGLALAALALWKYRRLLSIAGRLLGVLRIRRARRVRLARVCLRFRDGIRLILGLPPRRLLAVYALCAAHWLLRYSILFVLIRGAGADVACSAR